MLRTTVKNFLPFLIILVPFNLRNIFMREFKVYEKGDILDRDIRSPFSFYIKKTKEEIEKEKKMEEKKAPLVLYISQDVEDKINELIKKLEKGDFKGLKISEETKTILKSQEKRNLLKAVEITVKDILSTGYFLLKENYPPNKSVKIEKGENVFEEKVAGLVGPSEIDSILSCREKKYFPNNKKMQKAYTEIVLSLISPNIFLDRVKTEKEVKSRKISLVKTVVSKNEIIGRKGEKVNQAMCEKIKAIYELRYSNKFVGIILKENIFLFIILVIFYGVLSFFIKPDFRFSLLLSLLITIPSIGSLLSFPVFGPYALFFIFAAVGVSMFYRINIVVISILFFSIIFSYIFNPSFYFYCFIFTSSLVAGIVSLKIQTRFELYRPLLWGSITGILIYLLFHVDYFINVQESLQKVVIISSANLFALIGFYIFLPLLEKVGKVVSGITLSRLADLNHPLLKEFAIKAPGSYNHSITIAKLVETVDIPDFNKKLAVCGAYYHDIGKMNKPEYFIENQYSINPHDYLKPKISALILQAHVNDGVKIAQKYGLPEPVIKIIKEHHGTTVMEYFYTKALNNGEEVSEDDFRYQGPKPSSKESAVVMLADAVEARIRAEGFDSSEELRRKIREIFEKRIRDGQLNEVAISYKELGIIESSFFKTLLGVYHRRIKYEEGKNILKKKNSWKEQNKENNRKSS